MATAEAIVRELSDHFGIGAVDWPMRYVGRVNGGKLLIVSSGRCAWDDVKKAGGVPSPESGVHVMAVNDMTMHWPGPLWYAYSNDRRMLPNWIAARRPAYKRDQHRAIEAHTLRFGAVDGHWPFPGHGTSSLNACYVGIGMGYDDITLCGAPLDDSGHYFDPPWVSTNFTREVPPHSAHPDEPKWWREARRLFRGRVRAMSGRSAEVLGGA